VHPEFDYFSGDCADCPDEITLENCSIGGAEAVVCPFGRTSVNVTSGEAETCTKIAPQSFLEERVAFNKIVDGPIHNSSAYFDFVKLSARSFINRSSENKVNSPYIDDVVEAHSALQSSYRQLCSIIGINKTARMALQEVIRHTFLIGLVNDRDGLTLSEFKHIDVRNRSKNANDVRWHSRRMAAEQISPAVTTYLKLQNERGNIVRRVGIQKCINILRDPEFQRLARDAGMDGEIDPLILRDVIKSIQRDEDDRR
jgi:hypothetical protein